MSSSAVAHESTGIDFSQTVARNVRTMLAMRRLHAEALADAIGLSPQQLSKRMGGTNRWLAVEVKEMARFFGVPADVLLADDETDFKKALLASGYKRNDAGLELIRGTVVTGQQQLSFPPSLLAVS